MDNIGSFFSSIASTHRDGYKFIVLFLLSTILLGFISGFLGFFGLLLTIWCIAFFRDPPRMIATGENIILSPADGIVCSITETKYPEQLQFGDEKTVRVSIFMSVFDCHINRSPIAGEVEQKHYVKGEFLNAGNDKASDKNERMIYSIVSPGVPSSGIPSSGVRCVMVQIAGLLARRIVSFADENTSLDQGQRIGLIRFGSRVDVYLPPSVQSCVLIGQKSVAGETILADLDNKKQKHRTGRIE